MVFLVRLLINAAALWVAVQVVDGIDHRGSIWSLLFVALVFGALNASIRPVLKLLSLPLVILTLGLFMFVINALMLMMTGWVSRLFNLGFLRGRVLGCLRRRTHHQHREPCSIGTYGCPEDESARGVTNASQLRDARSSSGVCL
jgi:putative membrane protein